MAKKRLKKAKKLAGTKTLDRPIQIPIKDVVVSG